jgi:hypothetical protein
MRAKRRAFFSYVHWLLRKCALGACRFWPTIAFAGHFVCYLLGSPIFLSDFVNRRLSVIRIASIGVSSILGHCHAIYPSEGSPSDCGNLPASINCP